MEELPNLPLTGNAVQSQLTSLRFLLKHAGLLTVLFPGILFYPGNYDLETGK